MSNHSPIYLCNGNSNIFHSPLFKFDAYWLNQDGFSELMVKWWNSFPPGPLTASLWKLKLDQLRSKHKGWNVNLKRVITYKKHKLCSSISIFEELIENRALTDDGYVIFFC
jgi:hypothetical protein